MLLRHPTAIELPMSNRYRNPAIVVLYNCVPKCGSYLMNILFQLLSNQTGAFTFIYDSRYIHHHLSAVEQHNLTIDLLKYTKNASGQPVVYERHFHFIHLTSTSNQIIYYINQLRDPLKRTLSHFDFRRFTCVVAHDETQCSLIHSSLRNMTMDECVSTGDPGRCITHPYGVRSPIAYFCGQSSICDDTVTRPTSDAALALAKSNIEQYYIYIGLLEYLESSLELLEHIQPLMFTGLVSTYVNIVKRRSINQVPKKYRHSTTNRTRDVLRQLLKPEYELYNFIRMRFIDHYTRVFHRAPIYHET
ncbi:unnamed protein product [Rotaria sp. Silwood2]|nr:unnamed protein product [Rotaria sp. Silwood2]